MSTQELLRDIIGHNHGNIEVMNIIPNNTGIKVIFAVEQPRVSTRLEHRNLADDGKFMVGQRWSL